MNPASLNTSVHQSINKKLILIKRIQTGIFLFEFSRYLIWPDILNFKLDHHGIRDLYLNWIKELLTNRSGQVVVDNMSSELSPVVSGVAITGFSV